MYTDRCTNVLTRGAFLCAFAALLGLVPLDVAANPTGDTYNHSVTNFPLTEADDITFDPAASVVGGQVVREFAFSWGGGGSGAYAAPGEALEYFYSTVDSLPFVDPRGGSHNPDLPSRYVISGLDWGTGEAGVVRQDSLFLWFSDANDPIPFGIDPPPQGFYGTYPYGGLTHDVWFIGNNAFDAAFMGLATDAIQDGGSLTDVLNAVGIEPTAVVDIRVSYLVDHAPAPEPGSAALLLLGALAIGAARRR